MHIHIFVCTYSMHIFMLSWSFNKVSFQYIYTFYIGGLSMWGAAAAARWFLWNDECATDIALLNSTFNQDEAHWIENRKKSFSCGFNVICGIYIFTGCQLFISSIYTLDFLLIHRHTCTLFIHLTLNIICMYIFKYRHNFTLPVCSFFLSFNSKWCHFCISVSLLYFHIAMQKCKKKIITGKECVAARTKWRCYSS